MSKYSKRSQELADELREKATSNLARSAKSGRYISPSYAKKHPSTTTVTAKHGDGAANIKKK